MFISIDSNKIVKLVGLIINKPICYHNHHNTAAYVDQGIIVKSMTLITFHPLISMV